MNSPCPALFLFLFFDRRRGRFVRVGHLETRFEAEALGDPVRLLGLIFEADNPLLVRSAIDALPEPHRSVLTLRDLEERDTRETASLLGVSPAAVKTRLHRARTALRTTLRERHGALLDAEVAKSA